MGEPWTWTQVANAANVRRCNINDGVLRDLNGVATIEQLEGVLDPAGVDELRQVADRAQTTGREVVWATQRLRVPLLQHARRGGPLPARVVLFRLTPGDSSVAVRFAGAEHLGETMPSYKTLPDIIA